MTHTVRTCSFVLALLVASTSAFAQTSADTIRARVKPGQRVVLTDDQGQERQGKIGTLSADALALIVDGRSSDVPYERIVRIGRPHDGLGNGAGIGFLVGAGIVAIPTIAECGRNGRRAGLDSIGCAVGIVFTPILGGVGALIGLGVDAAIHENPEIYQRGRNARVSVAPMLTPSVRAAAVSVSW